MNGDDGVPATILEISANEEHTKSNNDEQSGRQDDGQTGTKDDGQTDGTASQDEKKSAETITGINSQHIGHSGMETAESGGSKHIVNGSTNSQDERVSSEAAIMEC